MNATRHAITLGLRRGWTEFVLSIRSTQDQGFYLFMGVATLAYLWFNRDTEVEGTDLLLPTVALPSLLGALLAFGVVIGPAYSLAMEREDGTLLRHKALPRGMPSSRSMARANAGPITTPKASRAASMLGSE